MLHDAVRRQRPAQAGARINMYTKKFKDWFPIKEHLELTIFEEIQSEAETLRIGEIRWCSLGVNIGSEIDGKGDRFLRPCLIIGIFSTRLALVVPLSTKIKNIPGYVGFKFNGVEYSACVMQTKTISQKRIFEREGKLNDQSVKEIKDKFKVFYRL